MLTLEAYLISKNSLRHMLKKMKFKLLVGQNRGKQRIKGSMIYLKVINMKSSLTLMLGRVEVGGLQ